MAAKACSAAGPWADRFHAMTPAEAFAWLVAPVPAKTFFADFWERRPLHVARKDEARYADLLNQEAIATQLKPPNGLLRGKEINIARCIGGKQVMEKGAEVVTATAVARAIAGGCSVQVVHPQKFAPGVAALLSRLETHFGCLWGSNSFHTPPASRGFKAHHDEVEVFMLQLEGAKHWRLYECPSGPLPRSYCWDYVESQLGPPVMEVCLRAGDLLYLPRGTIHIGVALEEESSHHLTVSTYQRTCWADFLGRALPSALERAAAAEARYRAGLPLRYLSFLGENHRPGGVAALGDAEEERIAATSAAAAFRATFCELVQGLCAHSDAALDATGDLLAAQFVARCLPPAPAARPVSRCGPEPASFEAQGGRGAMRLCARWAEPGSVRVVVEARPGEEAETQIYHSLENQASAHFGEAEPEPACLVLEGEDCVPTLRVLNRRAPAWTRVADLATPPPWELLQALWEHRLIETTSEPLVDTPSSGTIAVAAREPGAPSTGGLRSRGRRRKFMGSAEGSTASTRAARGPVGGGSAAAHQSRATHRLHLLRVLGKRPSSASASSQPKRRVRR